MFFDHLILEMVKLFNQFIIFLLIFQHYIFDFFLLSTWKVLSFLNQLIIHQLTNIPTHYSKHKCQSSLATSNSKSSNLHSPLSIYPICVTNSSSKSHHWHYWTSSSNESIVWIYSFQWFWTSLLTSSLYQTHIKTTPRNHPKNYPYWNKVRSFLLTC